MSRSFGASSPVGAKDIEITGAVAIADDGEDLCDILLAGIDEEEITIIAVLIAWGGDHY
jgi:hypothetical protein